MKRKIFLVLLTLCMIFVVFTSVSASNDLIESPAIAVQRGSYLYYINNGTKITRRNIRNGKEKILKTGLFWGMFLKGKYLYITEGTGSFGDAYSCEYIARMRVDGKGYKRLAMGYHPVVVGKYVYYRGLEKNGQTYQGTGLCRIKYNGRDNRILYSGTPGDMVGAGGGLIYWKQNDQYHTYNVSTGDMNHNISLPTLYSNVFSSETIASDGRFTYYSNAGKLYRARPGKTVEIASVPGTITTISVTKNCVVFTTSGGYTSGDYSYNIYMIRRNGEDLVRLGHGYLAN